MSLKTRNKMETVTDKKQIKSFLERGVEGIFPSKEFLEKRLLEGKPLTMYLGIDPTGPSLHLGHSIQLKKLGEFQKLGHKAILLIGDFTAMIGDPSDKLSTRKQLTREEVLENAKLYKKQAETFLDFKGDNPAELKYNSEWLSKLSFEDVLNLASKMTVDQMLKRNMFNERTKAGKPIFIHEFLYPLMQGYDAVAMDVDGELGGNDQMFNMLVGRQLMKSISNKEKFVITNKLLEDSTGTKMGKTQGNMVSLDDSPQEMFGKIMSWTDGMIIPGFELLTNVSNEEIEEIKEHIKKGSQAREWKITLAKEILRVFYEEEKVLTTTEDYIEVKNRKYSKVVEEVKEEFEKRFSNKEQPEVFDEVKKDGDLMKSLLSASVLESSSAFKRLVEQGGITNLKTEEKISEFKTEVSKGDRFKIGKKRFIEIV